jgi:hypothetical protein
MLRTKLIALGVSSSPLFKGEVGRGFSRQEKNGDFVINVNNKRF